MYVRSRRLNNRIISVWPTGDHSVVLRYGTIGVLPLFLIISPSLIPPPPGDATTRFQAMAFSYGASRSDTPHLAGLLWTDDQPDAETSTCQHTTFVKDRHPCPTAGFVPIIPANERPQTHALDRAAAGIGIVFDYRDKFTFFLSWCKPYRAVKK